MTFEDIFDTYFSVNETLHNEEEVVPIANIFCALSFLCQGSKSTKLEQTFAEFSRYSKDGLSCKELNEYLEAHLLMLFCLCAEKKQRINSAQQAKIEALLGGTDLGEKDDVLAEVKDICVLLATEIFAVSAGYRRDEDLISFGEFAQFYVREGSEIVSWLELLDLEKWKLSQYCAQTDSAGEDKKTVDDSQGISSDKKIDKMFSFAMSRSGDELIINRCDVVKFQLLLSETRMYGVSPDKMLSLVAKFGNLSSATVVKDMIREVRCLCEVPPTTKSFIATTLEPLLVRLLSINRIRTGDEILSQKLTVIGLVAFAQEQRVSNLSWHFMNFARSWI